MRVLRAAVKTAFITHKSVCFVRFLLLRVYNNAPVILLLRDWSNARRVHGDLINCHKRVHLLRVSCKKWPEVYRYKARHLTHEF